MIRAVKTLASHQCAVILMLVIVGIIMGIGFVVSSKVYAGPGCSSQNGAPSFGNMTFYGYFDGNQQCFGGDYVFPGGEKATDVNTFINDIRNYYNGASSHEKTGATFIILTMMNQPAGTPRNAAGTFDAAPYGGTSLADQWARLVEQYDAAGLINWNYTTPGNFSCRNTFYQTTYNDVADYNDCNGARNQSSIAFLSPSDGSVLYVIKKVCGNPLGNLSPLSNIATGSINGIDVDSTSGANMAASFNPTVTATSSSGSTDAIYKNVSGVEVFGIDGLPVSDPATSYTVSVPSSYTYSGKTYTPVRSTFCDSTDHPGCDNGLTTTSGAPDVIYSSGATTQQIHLKPNHVINMRWFWQVGSCTGSSCGVGGLSCQGLDMTHVPVTFGNGNNGETTYDPSNGDKHNPPSSPQPGDKKDVRQAVSYEAVSATDANTNKTLPVNSDKTTIDFTQSVKDYPYDSNKANVTYTDTYTTTEYTWTVDSSGNGSWGSGTVLQGTQVSGQFSDGTAHLSECYYRNFDVLPPSSTDVEGVTLNYSGRPNDENPNQAVVSTQVNVHFTLTPVSGAQEQLRAPMSVAGLRYSASYQIRRPVPGTNTYTTISLGPASQPVDTITCATTSTDCTVPFAFAPTPITVSVGSSSGQLRPGDIVCAQFTIDPATGKTDEGGSIQPGSSGSVNSTRIPGGSTCSSPLVNEPYFKVFGGDISVGNPFAIGGCSLSSAPNAGVYGWNTEDGINGYPAHPYAGAGAQYAVTALADSKDVASNQFNPNSSYPTPGNSKGIELSFATGTSPSSGQFVSGFGAAQSCIPDYFAGAASASGGVPSSNVSSLASNSYYANSNITLSGGNIATGKHIIIYAAGNVYITGDIKFANGSYTSIDSIPSFVVVAKGNINIDRGVKELAGVYIAEPASTSSSDGVISDCATAGGPLPNSQLYTNCSAPLTVNGSFIAKKINLLRTGNQANDQITASLRGSFPGETITNTNAPVPANVSYSCPSGGSLSGDRCTTTSTTSSYYMASWSSSCSSTQSYYEGNCYDNWTGKLIGPGTFYGYSCPSGGSLSGDICITSTTTSSYYMATPSYACPNGSTPDAAHMCSNGSSTLTNASELFNYGPAFWMNVALPTTSSQYSNYDSITSLPPVL